MSARRHWIVVPLVALLGLAGCVAYGPGYAPRHHGGYYAPRPAYVAPAPRPYVPYHNHHRHPYRRW